MTQTVQQEQTFFPDPATDRLLALVFNLAAELQVVRERVRVLEHVLESRGVIARADVEAVDAGAAVEAELARDRRDFVEHFLAPVTGRAASRNDVVAAEGGLA